VEKLVELKTCFKIPFSKDRSVGCAATRISALKPWVVTSYAIHWALTWKFTISSAQPTGF